MSFNFILNYHKNRNFFTFFVMLVAIMPSMPMLRLSIESSMAFHMLFQLPMLLFAGYMINVRLREYYLLNEIVAMWVWVYFCGLFWMMPISLDKALIYPLWDIFKIVSLLVTGALLKVVFIKYNVLSLFFIGSSSMMLFFVGMYFQNTNVRLCNAYLIESQQVTGIGLIVFASLILLALVLYLIKSDRSTNVIHPLRI